MKVGSGFFRRNNSSNVDVEKQSYCGLVLDVGLNVSLLGYETGW